MDIRGSYTVEEKVDTPITYSKGAEEFGADYGHVPQGYIQHVRSASF